jgi:hypothetical protein
MEVDEATLRAIHLPSYVAVIEVEAKSIGRCSSSAMVCREDAGEH